MPDTPPYVAVALTGLRTLLLDPPGTPDTIHSDPYALPPRFDLRLTDGGEVLGWAEVGAVDGTRPRRYMRLHLHAPAFIALADLSGDTTLFAASIGVDAADGTLDVRELVPTKGDVQYYNIVNNATLADDKLHLYHDGTVYLVRRSDNILPFVGQHLPDLLGEGRVDLGTLPVTPRPAFRDVQIFLARLLLYAFIRTCYRRRMRVTAAEVAPQTATPEAPTLAVREMPAPYSPAPQQDESPPEAYADRLDAPDWIAPVHVPVPPDFDPVAYIAASIAAQGLVYARSTIEAFYVALQTKGFVILSGQSGVGKTRLATTFARAFAVSHLLFVAVRPDFRDSRSLLGFDNPLTDTYNATPLARFLIEAEGAYARGSYAPYFVVLDEMNLARVEYYFADFLSVLEAGRDAAGFTYQAISLHTAEGRDVPQSLRLPPNLYFIGTVNIDETTSGFSPKVLDRAFSLDLASDSDDLALFLGISEKSPQDAPLTNDVPPLTTRNISPPDERAAGLVEKFGRGGTGALVDGAAAHAFFRSDAGGRYAADLNNLNTRLSRYDFGLAYRAVSEIGAFMANAASLPTHDLDTFFDWAIMMKVLPRMSGSRARLTAPLLAVLEWAGGEQEEMREAADFLALADDLRRQLRGDVYDSSFRYPRVGYKTARMLYSLSTQGYASYA